MKKFLCLVLALSMVLSCMLGYADTETLFVALNKPLVSADLHTEFGLKLNEPFEFINELIAAEDMEDFPIDLKMLAESACDVTEIADASYISSDDGKKVKMSAVSQMTLPLTFSSDFKAEIWTQTGVWTDIDLTNTDEPNFKVIYKIPFSTKYLVLDYADLIAADEFSAEQFAGYVNKYTDKEFINELNTFFKVLILNNMTIKETTSNKEYILTADDAAVKMIIKETANKLYDIIMDALKMQDVTGGEDYRYQFEQYLAILDEFTIVGDEGLQVRIALKDKQISVSEFSLHIDCNLHDALTAYGVDMGKFNREKWQIDCVLSVKSTYENVNKKEEITFPELTEENSEKIYDPERYEYESRYEWATVQSSVPVQPDENGDFMLPLADTMAGFEIAKKYYSVTDDKITITPREDQYDFGSAEMTIGSNVIIVDGEETSLKSNVAESENGTILIPVDAVTTMTGYKIEQISHYFNSEYFSGDSVSFERLNPEYIEEDIYTYVSPYMHIYGDGRPVTTGDEIYIPLRSTMLDFGIAEENIKVENGEIYVDDTDEKAVEFSNLKFVENSCEVYVDSVCIVLDNPVIEIDGCAYFPSQLLGFLNCRLNSISYYTDNKTYTINIYREMVDADDKWQPTGEFLYLSVEDYNLPIIKDGEYYLPLWPLMGEFEVRGEDILETEDTATVLSSNQISGFNKIVFNGTSVVIDDNEYTMSKPMVTRDGKKYLPSEFVTDIVGGKMSSMRVYFGEDGGMTYVYDIQRPNPLYVEK